MGFIKKILFGKKGEQAQTAVPCSQQIREPQKRTQECVTEAEPHVSKCFWCGRILAPGVRFECSECARPAWEKHTEAIERIDFAKLFHHLFRGPEYDYLGAYAFGLDVRNGDAWMLDWTKMCAKDSDGKLYGKRITYQQLHQYACAASGAEEKIRGLTSKNWYVYTLLPVDTLIVFAAAGGGGRYSNITRYGLRIREDDYFVECMTGGPMTGMFGDTWTIPIGFFANKTIEEVRDFIYDNKGYVNADEISIDDGELMALIRTDKERLLQQTKSQ